MIIGTKKYSGQKYPLCAEIEIAYALKNMSKRDIFSLFHTLCIAGKYTTLLSCIMESFLYKHTCRYGPFLLLIAESFFFRLYHLVGTYHISIAELLWEKMSNAAFQ